MVQIRGHEEADRLFLGRAHGFVTMGIFARTSRVSTARSSRCISHGFISGALFLCVGVIYDLDAHPRQKISTPMAGCVVRMPAYCGDPSCCSPWPMLGLPGTSGFVGEFLDADSVSSRSTPGSARGGRDRRDPLSACYALWLYPPRGVRRPDQGKPQVDHRHDRAGKGDLRAACPS